MDFHSFVYLQLGKLLSYLFFSIFCFASSIVSAQSKHYVLVLSKGSHELLVLYYSSLHIVSRIATGEDSHEIVTNRDGSLAYISNPSMNNMGHEIDVVDGYFVVVDIPSKKVIKDIDTHVLGLHRLKFTPGRPDGITAVVVN